jgi:two-component system response regulator
LEGKRSVAQILEAWRVRLKAMPFGPDRVARDGAEAMEHLFGADTEGAFHEAPRLILLELKLPKVDGHELLKRIKSDPRTLAVPVVVLTSGEERDVMPTYQKGANATS